MNKAIITAVYFLHTLFVTLWAKSHIQRNKGKLIASLVAECGLLVFTLGTILLLDVSLLTIW